MLKIRHILPIALASMVSAAGLTAVAEHHGENHADKPAGKEHQWQGHKKKHGEFMKSLNLSEAQQNEIQALKRAFYENNKAQIDAKHAKMKSLMERKKSGELSKEAFMAERKALDTEFSSLNAARKNMYEQIKSKLTPAQQAQWEAKKTEWQAKRGQKKPSPQQE